MLLVVVFVSADETSFPQMAFFQYVELSQRTLCRDPLRP